METSNDAPRRYIVAEIGFRRDREPEYYLQLGDVLVACQEKYAWIDGIGGLDALRRGTCPDHFSKAVVDGDGNMRPFYDPLLVWGRGIPPSEAIALLRADVPVSLGFVGWPDPDNGL